MNKSTLGKYHLLRVEGITFLLQQVVRVSTSEVLKHSSYLCTVKESPKNLSNFSDF